MGRHKQIIFVMNTSLSTRNFKKLLEQDSSKMYLWTAAMMNSCDMLGDLSLIMHCACKNDFQPIFEKIKKYEQALQSVSLRPHSPPRKRKLSENISIPKTNESNASTSSPSDSKKAKSTKPNTTSISTSTSPLPDADLEILSTTATPLPLHITHPTGFPLLQSPASSQGTIAPVTARPEVRIEAQKDSTSLNHKNDNNAVLPLTRKELLEKSLAELGNRTNPQQMSKTCRHCRKKMSAVLSNSTIPGDDYSDVTDGSPLCYDCFIICKNVKTCVSCRMDIGSQHNRLFKRADGTYECHKCFYGETPL